MRHFAHNIGDYAAATAHLSFIEDAAYHRLLRRYYQDEKPLPTALTDCQRLVGARTKEEREAVRVVLEEFFTLQADGWHQSRADREIAGYQERAAIARENGAKSGGRPKPRGNPSGYRIGSDDKPTEKPNPNQTQKLTTPHSPSSVPNGTDAADAASVVFRQGLAWMTKATGKPEGNCRSQLGKWRKEIGDEALIAVLGAAQREGPIDAMAWLEKAVASRTGGKPRKPWEKPPADALPPAEPWEQRMSGWRKNGFWVPGTWGPRPNEPGTLVPPSLRGDA